MGACYTKIEATEICAGLGRGLRVLAAGMALVCCGGFLPVFAQGGSGVVQSADVLRGTVVNGVTHEAIGRALVYSPDNRFATMTDERGHFEFTFARTEGEHTNTFTSTFTSSSTGGYSGRSEVISTGIPQAPQTGTDRPGQLMARKTGFLGRPGHESVPVSPEQHELTISLVPEGRIVGQVILPGADGSDRIQVDLYRRQVREGRERWEQAGSTMSRADGEFRFVELAAGSYKLFTNELLDRDPNELLDRDPVTSNQRGQLFGYPPVYYPEASDFATAAVIRLSAGETFQASLSPARREYYPVKVGIANNAPGQQPQIDVWPQGNEGPGYSLGYNFRDGSIIGSLPNGTYTVHVSTYGPTALSGTSNITVAGAAVSGQVVTLSPSSAIAVSVREEFQHAQEPSTTTVSDQFGRTFTASARRPNYLQVTLVPAEGFGSRPEISLPPAAGPEDESLVLQNVSPGRYRVRVATSLGFVSSVESGGTDLQRQPLVVGAGAAPPRIEVTVRDDGAEVEGTIEGAGGSETAGTLVVSGGQYQRIVYFLPTESSGGQWKQAYAFPDGKFQAPQLAPGTYRVLAFDSPQQDLEYASEEVMSQYDSKTQIITVVPGQKVQLRLALIPSGE
jgi:hypothetical protein